MPCELPKLYTIEEASEVLGFPTLNTVRWLVRTNKIGYRKVAGKIRFAKSDILEYIDRVAVKPCCASDNIEGRCHL